MVHTHVEYWRKYLSYTGRIPMILGSLRSCWTGVIKAKRISAIVVIVVLA